METKDTNPKDAVGVKKWRQFCTVPFTVIWELGVAMLEGARKYGRHNYRVSGVRGSVYIDAAMGHLSQWWEGEDIDADSGMSHIIKAIASLAVMRDAMINDKFIDDRPPKSKLAETRDRLQSKVEEIIARYPDAKEPFLDNYKPVGINPILTTPGESYSIMDFADLPVGTLFEWADSKAGPNIKFNDKQYVYNNEIVSVSPFIFTDVRKLTWKGLGFNG